MTDEKARQNGLVDSDAKGAEYTTEARTANGE